MGEAGVWAAVLLLPIICTVKRFAFDRLVDLECVERDFERWSPVDE